ncbi:MAG: hypothetical protein JW966_06370 [Anaerolineae bacterium]|nr:hypothetical protein [Anaerolineae bacterium]
MERYTCDPNLEVIGFVPLGFFGTLQEDTMRPILSNLGLNFSQFQPDTWYPLQLILDILYEFQQHDDTMYNYVAFGMRVAETINVPSEPSSETFAEFLVGFEKLYPERYRNGDPGYVHVQRLAERKIKLTFDVPYPDDTFYGLFYGYCRRFLPQGTSFSVLYDPDSLRKDEGGQETTIWVEWKD